jgi:aspartyl-tRNA(Asn)/glutamyl-tRNA(Gln) amidotransferase subunit C
MALTTDDVLHIANLARLPLSQEEIERLQHQLSDVLQYFEQLQEVDTLETVPTSQTTGLALSGIK